MNPAAIREGVTIAVDSLRSNKVRSFLTILGIVIGVFTVMLMAAVITGLRSSITAELEAMGPKSFMLMRFDQTQLELVNDGSRRPWEGKPPITMDESRLIASLPSIASVAPNVNSNADLKFGKTTSSGVQVMGRGSEWPNYAQGDFLEGRNFVPMEEDRSARVVILSDKLAKSIFGRKSAVGEMVRLRGEPFQVIGVYRQTPNVFSALMEKWVIVPPSSAIKYLGADEKWMDLLIVPSDAVSQTQAIDDVTSTLRTSRGLRPIAENNFAVVKQEAFLEMFNRLTGTFFIVMLVLASIGLMVGGVGVVAITLISVTERTREIGVRKALGATRREILFQFLVEAVTVTLIGGILGLVLALGASLLIASISPIPATIPPWAIAVALGIFTVAGIAFGVYPANKASRLDPVEALRYE